MKNQKQTIKCSECGYCSGLRPVGNTRTEFTCTHPDRDYLKNYFHEKRINKMLAFIGFGARYSNVVPIKTAPAWCPKKKALRKMNQGLARNNREMQQMLYFPFSFKSTIYSILYLTYPISCAIINFLLNFVQFRNGKHTLFKFVRSQKV